MCIDHTRRKPPKLRKIKLSGSFCYARAPPSQTRFGKASDLPVTAVKQCAGILSPALAAYFNHFLQVGKFPDILKIGRITPVYKNKGSRQNFNNFRPISTLPIFGKIFEKLIYNRLYSFLTSQNLIFSKQFGFRKRHSTSHALNYSVDQLTKSIASGQHTIGIFIDLSKAFDTIIDHQKLLVKGHISKPI